ncbi:NAD(P)-binding protein [Acephala macrosclerotiorum]|nr:NAD(P)-binding protein [Acephala macrosclerotiorum]
MSEEIVLITGVSGFIGHEVLRQTLEAGYNVRAVIRKESNIEMTKQALANPELFSKIDFPVIPDLAAPDAFDKSLFGVTSIIHVASPVETSAPSDNYERDYYRPVINISTNILKAANETPSVRRIIVTSSISAYIPLMDITLPHPLLAYAASKAMSLDAAQEFLDKRKPDFDVSTRHDAEEVSVHGTNKLVMNLLLGKPNDPSLGSSVSLHDVAKLHVLALKKSIPAGRYMVASGGKKGTNWTDAHSIAKKHFPKESERLFVKEGERHSVKINIDTTETEKVFGLKFQSFEEQVKSVVSSYLSILKKEGK